MLCCTFRMEVLFSTEKLTLALHTSRLFFSLQLSLYILVNSSVCVHLCKYVFMYVVLSRVSD